MLLSFTANLIGENTAISPRHMELPTGYPNVARIARLQGTITVKLTISGDGNVVAAEATNLDDLLRTHPLLQNEAEQLSRQWTFTCINCAKESAYTYSLVFSYRLEGKASQYADSKVAVDLPNRVTVTANPPVAMP